MKRVSKNELKNLLRNTLSIEVEQSVSKILEGVRLRGDEALIDFERQFDHVELNAQEFKVSSKELIQAGTQVSKSVRSVLAVMIKNVRRYQKDLLYHDWIKSYSSGKAGGKIHLGSLVRPLDRVGVYIPGGTAPLISTVVMTVIPAKVAGVKEIIVTTPPNQSGKINPYILEACRLTGASHVYKLGGAQAIGALAFGTQTVPRVDKIVGPGNKYVASAKRQVYGLVGIDMVAGPSEVLILADDSANPKHVAADLLAQAEHDVMAKTFLVTPSMKLIEATEQEIHLQIQRLTRKETAEVSIRERGYAVKVKNLEEAVEVANKIAPEHLEILCRRPSSLIQKLRSAGAIFVGDSTPEPVGDYVAGPSHVLPTGGTARFFSPLSSRDFLKSMSYLKYDQKSLTKDLKVIQSIATLEGLDAHQKSAEVRFL
ncbi:MAG: histidinol dehydrogenase [Chlamydiae bacterium]|nr:histidinol dehydrogenase [Chlamydiota bacterium]MBI3277533.1 histidinol dehydrogenase [Chlamydiota bacterium]